MRKLPRHSHTADELGGAEYLNTSLALSKISGENIWLGDNDRLSSLIDGFATATAKLKFSKLSTIPYKLPTSAYNYVMNPSFEYGTWGGDETQSEDYAYEGKYSAKLACTGTDKSSGYSNWIDVRGYTTITVALKIKITARSAGYVYPRVYYYNSSKTYIEAENFATLSAVQDWTEHSITKTSFPSGTCFIRLRFVAWGNPTLTAYFDCWQVNIGDQIPAFQDFTTYAFNWMPEKIETQATSQISWSSTDWTDLLSLTFECESTMLLLILAHCRMECQNNYMFVRLLLDGVQLDDTYAFIGYHSADAIHDMYSVHSVQIKEKGSHTLKIQFAASTGTIYGHSRRLSIIKGFYKGGTT